MTRTISKQAWAWGFYDWANSAFATTVITALFPIFFKKYWSIGIDSAVSTAQLGTAHAFASALLAIITPVLGAFADRSGKKRHLLFTFALLGVVCTGLLFLVSAGAWQMAIGLFILANIGWSGGNALYDALLISVTGRRDMEFISAFGFSLGYLGGGLLFLVNVVMVTKPAFFGLADTAEATRWAFLSVAAWWAIFAIPLFLFVPEKHPGLARASDNGVEPRPGYMIRDAFRQVRVAATAVLKHRNIRIFLLAYFFYIDGVNTIIKMSVDFGVSIGLKQESLILAILMVQFVGFPATLGFGFLSGRIGPKGALFICLAAYVAGTIYAYFMQSETEFFVLAAMIGLVQGGVQSISRAVFGSMIPPGQAGQFFGFYNMLGKFSSVLGPLLVAIVSLVSHDPRIAILSIVLLFIIGGALLWRVPVARDRVT